MYQDGHHAMGKLPLHPKHPERICWGCDIYCPEDDMRCGNGTIRAPHPIELFGDDWFETELKTGRNTEPELQRDRRK